MKKLFVFAILTILITSSLAFVYAQGQQNQGQGNQETNQNQNQETENQEQEQNNESQGIGQTIRNRVKAGIYTSPNGEQIRVSEMVGGRIRLQTRNISVDCECNMTQETEQNRTRLRVRLSNGKHAEIKIMPDVASERALERLRLKVCSAENNCTIQLKEVPFGKNKTLAYELQVQRHMRILSLFRTKAQIKAQIDAETGEIIVVKKPWWAFLAKSEE